MKRRTTNSAGRPGPMRMAILTLLAGSTLLAGGCPPDGLKDPNVQVGLRAIADGLIDIFFAVALEDDAD